jgi:hypothetical protein
MRGRFDLDKCLDVRKWVAAAIRDEERHAPDPLWKNAPSAEEMYEERLRRIKFLRKYGRTHSDATIVADRLESCEPGRRCLSGACPECGRLLQRWFVRRSKIFIAEHIVQDKEELIAISIVPRDAVRRPGQLHTVDIVNLQRRLKYALDKTRINVGIGAIDFSFDEDRKGRYQAFWCPHFYLITSTSKKNKLGDLRKIYPRTTAIPKPVFISSFRNVSERRSYALKMKFTRRIGYHQVKNWNDKRRKCRNASCDELRAAERLELFIYLDQIGLADRVIFRRAKPVVTTLHYTTLHCKS